MSDRRPLGAVLGGVLRPGEKLRMRSATQRRGERAGARKEPLDDFDFPFAGEFESISPRPDAVAVGHRRKDGASERSGRAREAGGL